MDFTDEALARYRAEEKGVRNLFLGDLSIVVSEEDVLSVVAALCNVVRDSGQHDSRWPWHPGILQPAPRDVNK